MIEIKEILLEIGFKSGSSQYGFPALILESDLVIITASYLRMVPRLQMSAGFGFHVKYHDNRRLQIDPTYIPDKAENFEQGLALIYLAIGKNERQLFKETPDWYNSGRESVNLLPWFAARKKEQEEEKDGLLIIDDGYLKIGAAEILIHAVGT
ncbi:MAG: hypothetical protein IPN14_05860 [Bacteroidetes bacterium]|nr:hypothetical protein [Bacteroidota bacterium]